MKNTTDSFFLGITKPFAELVSEKLIALAQNTCGICDLSNVVLVTPGGRIGRTIEQFLLQHTNGKVFLPHCVTTGSLPQLVGCHPLTIATPLEELVCLHHCVAALEDGELEQLGVIPTIRNNESAMLAVAEDILATFHELGANAQTPESVLASLASGFGNIDKERWEILSLCFAKFQEKLFSQGKVTSDSFRQNLILFPDFNGENIIGQKKVILAGLGAINQATENLLRNVSDVSFWIFSDEAHAAGFSASGKVATEYWLQHRYSIATEALLCVQSSIDYAPAIATILSDGTQPSEMSISLPNEKEIPLLVTELTQYNVKLHQSGGIPITESTAGKAFLQLLEFSKQPTVALARNLVLNKTIQARLTITASEALLALANFRSKATSDLLFKLDDRVLIDLVNELQKIADAAVMGSQPLVDENEDVTTQLNDAISALQETEAFGLDRSLLLKNQLSKLKTADEQHDAAFEMLGWLEIPFDAAPIACIVGMNANVVPAPLTNCSFLPEALRKELGLETFDFRRARDRYLMQVLLSNKKKVLFICPNHDAEHNPLRPSELLFVTTSGEQLQRLKQMEASKTWLQPATANAVIQRVAILKKFLPDDSLSLPQSFSVTHLETYLRDPYEYYQRYVLKLRSHEETTEATPLMIGNILHDILNDFARSNEKDSTEERGIYAFFEQALGFAIEKHCRGVASNALLVQKELLHDRLRRLATFQALHRKSGWQISMSEINIEANKVFIAVGDQKVSIHGRIDRIDIHTETKERLLIDFKTNEKSKNALQFHKTRAGFQKLQLPFYNQLLEQTQQKADRSGFIFISRGQEAIDLAELEPDPAFEQEATDVIKACIQQILSRNFWPPSGKIFDQQLAWGDLLAQELTGDLS